MCEQSYFLTASAGYRSQHATDVFSCFSFFIPVALELLGCTMDSSQSSLLCIASFQKKYVFIQLILPSVAISKEGWLMQNYMPFLLFFSCLSPLLQFFGLLRLFSICEFWRSSNSVFLYSVSGYVLGMWTLAKKELNRQKSNL